MPLPPLRLLPVLCVCVLTGVAPAQDGPNAPAGAGDPAADDRPGAADVIQPAGLPAIGKWMLDPDGTPAHWLGETLHGKALREPINVILLDRRPGSAEDAVARLKAAAARAGYPLRTGHSGGYRGVIAGEPYPQLSAGDRQAFSDAPYYLDNDHGRIFGPYESQDGFLFVGAFSRESVHPFGNPRHQYVSFDRARDDFSERLDQATEFERVGFVDLENAVVADPKLTTGDHDGTAVVLQAE